MIKRIFIRLGWSVVVLIGAAAVSFLIARAVPGDPARVIAGAKADAETIALIRTELHLDDPLWKQFSRYLWQLGHGDLGKSYVTNQPVKEAILTRFPVTASLGNYRPRSMDGTCHSGWRAYREISRNAF